MRNDYRGESCGDGCCSIVAERNRFFTGKYLTARDLLAEQDYFLGRHRLHNRLLHGRGIACGFGVTCHPDPGCRGWVVVGPGIALDCCGRELVLTERRAFRVQPPPETAKPPERRFLLCAAYTEEDVEPVPVVYDDSGCDPRRREANRVRETVRLEQHPLADLESCWAVPGGATTTVHDDCDKKLPAPGGGCLEPDCPCGDLVPLALVTVDRDGTLQIDTRGRRLLPVAPELLTQVCATSWEHGATVSLDDLDKREKGRLEITFTREIAAADGIATGINAETLIVQHAGEGDDLKYVPYDQASPPRLVDGRHAVYDIDRGFLRRRGGSLAGSTIYVTLLADFVLDCHHRAVDGDHVGGRLPSGNGLPGGTFRSWFRVGDRPDYQAGDQAGDQKEAQR